MAKICKRNGKYYLRIRSGGTDKLLPTGESKKAAAQKTADKVNTELRRIELSGKLAQILISYAYQEAEAHFAATVRRPDDGHGSRFQALQRELTAQAQLLAIPLLELLAPSAPITAASLWSHYAATAGKSIKPVTLKTKAQRFAVFTRWAKERDLRNLSVDEAERFLSQLNNNKKQTRNNYISDLSSVFKSHSQVTNPWTAALRVTVDDASETPPLALETVRAILAYCDRNGEQRSRCIELSRWACFLRVLYYTGLRPVDACHLSVAALVNGAIDLEPIKTSRTKKRVNFVPDKKVIQLLSAAPAGADGLYFPEFADKYDRDRSALQKGFAQICDRAGYPGLQLYGFRHAFATYQLDSGAADVDLAAAIGHTSTVTTRQHYYHGKKRIALNDLPEV